MIFLFNFIPLYSKCFGFLITLSVLFQRFPNLLRAPLPPSCTQYKIRLEPFPQFLSSSSTEPLPSVLFSSIKSFYPFPSLCAVLTQNCFPYQEPFSKGLSRVNFVVFILCIETMFMMTDGWFIYEFSLLSLVYPEA